MDVDVVIAVSVGVVANSAIVVVDAIVDADVNILSEQKDKLYE